MMDITERAIREIEGRFKTGKGYILCRENPTYCPQVNGLVNICLTELGFQREARGNLAGFQSGPSYDPRTGLFHQEVDLGGRVIVSSFNTCKNSVFALALAASGFVAEAGKMVGDLRRSPAYIQCKGLFGRGLIQRVERSILYWLLKAIFGPLLPIP